MGLNKSFWEFFGGWGGEELWIEHGLLLLYRFYTYDKNNQIKSNNMNAKPKKQNSHP